MDDPLAKEEVLEVSLHFLYDHIEFTYYIHDFDARELKERMQELGTSSENSGVVTTGFS